MIKGKGPQAKELEPGVVYLVQGSLQQLSWYLSGLKKTIIYEAKTQDYYREYSYLAGKSRYVVFLTNYYQSTSKSNHVEAIPDNEQLILDTDTTYFLLADPLEYKSANRKKLYKMLNGGVYREIDIENCLDLRLIEKVNSIGIDIKDYIERPISLYRALKEGEIPQSTDMQKGLIDLIIKGMNGKPYSYWQEHVKPLVYSMFKIDGINGYPYPNDIVPFIQPVIERIRDLEYQTSVNELALFALYVKLAFTINVKVTERGTYINLYSKEGKHLQLWNILNS